MISCQLHLNDVSAYKPGASAEQIRQEYGLENVEKLASNENPLGPSPLAIEAAKAAIANSNIYGDGGAALRSSLAQFHNKNEDQISVNNGSDAIIHQIMRTFLRPDEHAVSCEGGFVSFQIAAKTVGSTPVLIPQKHGYRFDVEAIAAATTNKTKLVYVPNPNNPTGTFLSKSEISWLLEQLPTTTLVVLDEAYVQYAENLQPEEYPNSLNLDADNVLTLRTFSKAYGLAAFRIGYAVGHPSTISWLRKTKLPFDPNAIGCAAAIGALADTAHVTKTVELNKLGLFILSNTLQQNGYVSSSSIANFVMVDLGSSEKAQAFHRDLLKAGFITRPLAGFGLPSCVRISTGTQDQNIRLSTALAELAPRYIDN